MDPFIIIEKVFKPQAGLKGSQLGPSSYRTLIGYLKYNWSDEGKTVIIVQPSFII